MDYLTVKEVAELKGCSERYVQQSCKTGKVECVEKTTSKNRTKFLIPLSALSNELQERYYKQKRTETGIMPEKTESEESKDPSLKYRSKGTKRAFDSFSAEEREKIQFWIDLLNEWQAERSKRKDKTEFDKLFAAHQKYINADVNISPDILYRKYSTYKNECYEELIDKRGGWNKGKSKLADDSVIWQSFLSLYLDQSEPKISKCYRMVCAYIAEEYPELTVEIPSAACFRRKIETLPFAILDYSHNGDSMRNHRQRTAACHCNDNNVGERLPLRFALCSTYRGESEMMKFTGITFAPDFKNRTDSNFANAQKFVDSETLRLCDPYVPMLTGMLKKSGISGTVIGSGVVEYTAPYAKQQYYTNAGRGNGGINRQIGTKGLCGKLWLERMKADHLDEIERKVKEKFK